MSASELGLEGVIHDLNNVFQTIAESAEVLKSDPKWSRISKILRRSADHGQRLARSILEANRSAAEPVAVIERAVQFSSDYLERTEGPALSVEHEVQPGFRLAGDAASWERVLVNLFLNAAEAGATRVTVRAGGALMTIADNGRGIASDLLPHIFRPHVSTKSITGGLGLYVVQSVVELNGGVVSAANCEGGGAEFRIVLGESAVSAQAS